MNPNDEFPNLVSPEGGEPDEDSLVVELSGGIVSGIEVPPSNEQIVKDLLENLLQQIEDRGIVDGSLHWQIIAPSSVKAEIDGESNIQKHTPTGEIVLFTSWRWES
jgi:hypothetical protein